MFDSSDITEVPRRISGYQESFRGVSKGLRKLQGAFRFRDYVAFGGVSRAVPGDFRAFPGVSGGSLDTFKGIPRGIKSENTQERTLPTNHRSSKYAVPEADEVF